MIRRLLRHPVRTLREVLQIGATIREARRLQAEYAAIIGSSEDAIISKRLDGTIVSWNSSAERLFGYAAAEAVGRPITFLMPPDRVNEEKDIIARLVQGERIEHFETVRRRKDGRDVHVSLSISPIKNEAGQVIGAAKIARDITTQKQMESTLIASEELAQETARKNAALYEEAQQASRFKDEFLATLSHELRTPLNAIYGWIHMARTGMLDQDGIDRALETIDRNARMQCQLIDELLDVSRIISGKFRLDFAAIEIGPVIQAAVDVVRPTAGNKGLQLEVSLSPQLLPLWGDAVRLQQVIWNLLTNAIKFTPRGGTIHLRVEGIDHDLRITVTDTGEGIAPEFLPYVFDRFRQADSSSARKAGGLGLGLSLARYLVELHGGGITVASAGLGQGATLTVTLPCNPHRTEPAPAVQGMSALFPERPARLKGQLKDRHVLVVEDDSDSRQMLTTILESYGATVTAVASVAEAIGKLAEFMPDMLLSDIGLPGEDGYSLIRRIRSLPEPGKRAIRAIAVTAHARNEDREQALSAGYDAHLAKPFDPPALLKVIEMVCR